MVSRNKINFLGFFSRILGPFENNDQSLVLNFRFFPLQFRNNTVRNDLFQEHKRKILISKKGKRAPDFFHFFQMVIKIII